MEEHTGDIEAEENPPALQAWSTQFYQIKTQNHKKKSLPDSDVLCPTSLISFMFWKSKCPTSYTPFCDFDVSMYMPSAKRVTFFKTAPHILGRMIKISNQPSRLSILRQTPTCPWLSPPITSSIKLPAVSSSGLSSWCTSPRKINRTRSLLPLRCPEPWSHPYTGSSEAHVLPVRLVSSKPQALRNPSSFNAGPSQAKYSPTPSDQVQPVDLDGLSTLLS